MTSSCRPPQTVAACMELGSDLQAASRGRALARAAMAGWGLDALIDDVVLVVSELVGNALRHGRPPVGLSVRRQGDGVLVTVWERGDGPPSQAGTPPEWTRESGRGLAIVAALTVSVVWTRSSTDDGTSVTAAFALTRVRRGEA